MFLFELGSLHGTSNHVVSLDVVSLFTRVPIDEKLAVVWDELAADHLLEENTDILIDNLMETLTFCVETTYFGTGSDIYWQEEGLAMGSPLSPVLVNIYMEYFKEMAFGSTSLKTTMWLRDIDDIHSLTSSGRCSKIIWSRELNPTSYTVHYGERTR